MSVKRFGRLHKATALVPLTVLSTAWTASLAGFGPTTVAVANDPTGSLPDGTALPSEVIEAPASVTLPGAVAPAVPKGTAKKAVANADTAGIPSAALAAYQRAETVINAADKTCNISWQLIAAIGRVESDHGRYGGNVLNDEGVATPGIYGIALDGTNNTQRILDTDGGRYDNDTEFDRAVGPMQFIPSTWSVVGVDGDNDGKRGPQDIDDAALASAVYLCSGKDDLSTTAGQRAAIFRYNRSNDYVDLVLSIMRAYLDGEYISVPNSTTSSTPFTPAPSAPRGTPPSNRGALNPGSNQGGGSGLGYRPEPPRGDDDGGTPTQPAPPPGDENPPSPAPQPKPETPKDDPGKTIKDTIEGTVKDPGGTVTDVITQTEATAMCLAEVGASSLSELNILELAKVNACIAGLLT